MIYLFLKCNKNITDTEVEIFVTLIHVQFSYNSLKRKSKLSRNERFVGSDK